MSSASAWVVGASYMAVDCKRDAERGVQLLDDVQGRQGVDSCLKEWHVAGNVDAEDVAHDGPGPDLRLHQIRGRGRRAADSEEWPGWRPPISG